MSLKRKRLCWKNNVINAFLTENISIFFLTIDSLMFYSGFKNGRTANLFWEFARVSEERTGVLFLQVRSQHLKQIFLCAKFRK